VIVRLLNSHQVFSFCLSETRYLLYGMEKVWCAVFITHKRFCFFPDRVRGLVDSVMDRNRLCSDAAASHVNSDPHPDPEPNGSGSGLIFIFS